MAEHHHHHDHGGPAWSSSLTVRRILAGAIGALVLATVVGLVALWPRGDAVIGSDALGFGGGLGPRFYAIGTSTPVAFPRARRSSMIASSMSHRSGTSSRQAMSPKSSVSR